MATATVSNGTFAGVDTREKLTRLSDTEWDGVRFFWANTDDVTEAMLAAGLPAIDDPWDPVNLPDLKVTKIGPPAGSWGQEGATGMSGTILIPVYYKTPGIQVLPYEIGDAWTEIASGQTSIMVQTGLVWSGGEWKRDTTKPAINNGQGMQKTVGIVEARVTVIYSEAVFITKKNTWAQLATEQAFNDGAITIPPVRYGTTRLAIESGKAQYLGFEMEAIGKGKIRVTHRLGLFGANEYKWFELDEQGKPIGTDPITVQPWTIRHFEDL